MVITINGGTNNPADDVANDLHLWENVDTSIQFAGNHQVYQFDSIFWVYESQGFCTIPPIHEDLSGFLDAELRTNVKLPPGTHHLCLRQGDKITYHPHIRAITFSQPPSQPPFPPPPSSPPTPVPPPPLPPLGTILDLGIDLD